MYKKIIKFIKLKLRGECNIKKLKKNGMVIGKNFQYGSGCFFDPAHCFLINIGNDVTFSSKVHILAHDASTKKHIGYTKIGLITIEDNVFIGANCTVLPNVKIGKNSIIAAGAVVTKDVPEGEVWGGVPARKIQTLNEYLNKYDEACEFYGEEYTVLKGITDNMKNDMKERLKSKVGLVR